MVLWSIISILILLLGMVGVAFVTLMERKVLGLSQVRLGPNKMSFSGLLQPVADGVKLLWKAVFCLSQSQAFMYTLSPLALLFLFIVLWGWIIPWSGNENAFKYSVLLYFSMLGTSAYAVILTGWSSMSSFSKLGSLRGMLQSLSFEVALILIFMIVLSIMSSFSMTMEVMERTEILLLWITLWILVSLMETNRAPFDLLEGESELISGFNIEMGGLLFVFIFLSEYGMILIMGLIFSMAMLSMLKMYISMFFIMFILMMRSCFPRIRYDVMMEMMWQVVLPVSILIFMLFLF